MSLQPVAWILFALAMIVGDRRWASPAGQERLRGLDPWHASRVRSGYRSPWVVRLFHLGAALYAVRAVVAAVWGEPVDVGVGLVGAVAMVVAARSRVSAAPTILAVLDERDLPVTDREASRRRTRRVAVLGVVAFGSFVAAAGAMIVHGATDSGVAVVLAGGLTVVTFAALLGALWASVWVYGDERPAAG